MTEIERSQDTLAELVNREHRRYEQAVNRALDHALAVGELLLEAKPAYPHGTLVPWLEENTEESVRTAQAYICVATRRPEIEDQALDLPHVPEDAMIEELPAMKAADVRGCVEAIAAHACLDADELLAGAICEAGYEVRSAAHEKEDMEREVSREVRERTLPNDETLQKTARYEAHLSRQLYHALHELENLHEHRTTGEGVPLARVDVQGLSEG